MADTTKETLYRLVGHKAYVFASKCDAQRTGAKPIWARKVHEATHDDLTRYFIQLRDGRFYIDRLGRSNNAFWLNG